MRVHYLGKQHYEFCFHSGKSGSLAATSHPPPGKISIHASSSQASPELARDQVEFVSESILMPSGPDRKYWLAKYFGNKSLHAGMYKNLNSIHRNLKRQYN